MSRPADSWSAHFHFSFVVMGLDPEKYWGMTWQQYEWAIEAKLYERAHQLEGHRLVATQIYNMLAEKSLLPWEYLRLIIDKLPEINKKIAENRETPEEFRARMAATYLAPQPPPNN